MEKILTAGAINADGKQIDYSFCFATAVSNITLFREFCISRLTLLENSDLTEIIEFFDIKVENDLNPLSTEVEDLFHLENYEKYFELKALKSIMVNAINHIADKIESQRIAVCQSPLGSGNGYILIFSSQDRSDLNGDCITHYCLDLIEMSGILK